MKQYLPLPIEGYSKEDIYAIANSLEDLLETYKKIAREERDIKNGLYGFITFKGLMEELKSWETQQDTNTGATIQDRLKQFNVNRIRKEN